jgi:exodeoxyribonuclease VII small subunit
MAEREEDRYEAKFARLEAILERLDDSQTPIDALAADVKQGTQLILELKAKLREVETDVAEAFQALEAEAPKPPQ